MKKLDKFILTSFIGPFIAILFVVVFILMMQFLWLYIDELVGKGLGLRILAEFMMWGTCTILPLALPLATLLASMMIMGQLGENSELIALKAAGISLTRIFEPLIIVSIIISIGAFFIADDLVPVAYNKIYTLRDDIGKTKEEIKIPSGTFYDGIEGYVLRVQNRSDLNGMMYGVMVYDHSEGKGNVSLTLADSAIIKMSKAKDYLTFTLYKGTNYKETNMWNYMDTTFELQKVQFDRQQLVIPLVNYAFQQSKDARFGDQVKAMKIKQLKHGKDSLEKDQAVATRAFVREMAGRDYLTFNNQLDSTANTKVMTDFHCKGYMQWNNNTEEIAAYERAASQADQYSISLSTLSMDTYGSTFILRRTDVEIFRKFAQALACFILFFIGAPLGALIRKGGIGTSAIVSILFFVLYWVIDIIGTKLAKDGAITALVGASISTLVLFPTGMYLTWKAVHDSTLFNMDNFGTWWRSVKSHVGSFFRRTRIVYMGTPEFAVAPLEALIKNRYKVVGVVTTADKPSGRGLKVNESAVKQYAVAHNIPVLQPEKLKDPEFLKQLKALKGDLFVVVAFRMLPEVVWSMPRLGTFNLHAALLPQYRGAAPINWAVINGENITGVTSFMIDKDIDTGGIMLRQESRIKETDSAGDVHDRLMAIGADVVVRTTEGIIEKNIETRVQRSFIQGSEVLKPAPKITKELCHIDWNDDTKNVYNLIRGLSPYPGAFTEIVKEGKDPLQMKIFASEKVFGDDFVDMKSKAGVDNVIPGQILSDGKSFIAIATVDGAVSIKELQLSGKKRMVVKDFLVGFREPSSYSTTEGTSKAEIAKTKA